MSAELRIRPIRQTTNFSFSFLLFLEMKTGVFVFMCHTKRITLFVYDTMRDCQCLKQKQNKSIWILSLLNELTAKDIISKELRKI